ncbi:MAG TPA: YceI family protein [Polyangia bacterium]|nr:YceI family protein [Polyangia bacterium]
MFLVYVTLAVAGALLLAGARIVRPGGMTLVGHPPINRALSAWVALGAAAVVLMTAVTSRGGQAEAGRALSLVVAPGASLELDGDSSLHRYSAKAHGIEAGIGVDTDHVPTAAQASDLEDLVRGHFIKTFHLFVPVDKLSSGDKGLDTNMRKALKGDRYKQIRFQMDSYDVLGSPAGTMPLTVTLHGRLSLAGVERKIDVTAAGVRVREGLAISGSKDLLMTDYQIKPPTMMLGAIKTKDLITVKFSATLEREHTQ